MNTSTKLNMPIYADQIKKMLPHRYPFLLVDRVTKLEPGVSGTALKNVTINEPFFQGHFPEELVMPGVLIAEAMAQLIALIYIAESMEKADDYATHDIPFSDQVGYLLGFKNMKFKAKVIPGDQLIMRATIVGKFGPMSQVQVFADVDGKNVVEGIINVSEKV
ncbi:3-hydroxyacyl-[acyl-carrier-protein] dehydratase [Paenibacillus shirakamiensis]|uniref:3-hydroxyacyl-[acyl-carrier-protein] dehydratase n=1 Tax=Paenibacillus shirakamiensis TaxID=1265935 RepID=A0ABS4JFH4_9BACL|nr:3-hydroxyacyl-ACP dehydratase FabZ [Paenibacillus shirakamiensis]MBP2000453.1 3-hydroxyacyl-[acyl-carrier-protein] dehydratase [Paenibacillus shirakamiensis]